MALDHALATALPPGEAVLRLYSWEGPAVSFGKNEPADGVYDRALGEQRGVAFVRRPTGGGSVYHAAEVTYAVAAPVRAFGGLREAYRRIHRALVAGLRGLGVDAIVVEEGTVSSPGDGPCFRAPAPGEIAAGGAKLVGSAQARMGDAFLQHGSILLDGDQGVLQELSGRTVPPAAVSTLAGLGLRVERDEVAAALADGVRLALRGTWAEGGYRTPELDEAERLEWTRYAAPAWTWGR